MEGQSKEVEGSIFFADENKSSLLPKFMKERVV
jgi:hypothetical protein